MAHDRPAGPAGARAVRDRRLPRLRRAGQRGAAGLLHADLQRHRRPPRDRGRGRQLVRGRAARSSRRWWSRRWPGSATWSATRGCCCSRPRSPRSASGCWRSRRASRRSSSGGRCRARTSSGSRWRSAIIHRRTANSGRQALLTRRAAAILVGALELSVIIGALTSGVLVEATSMGFLLALPAIVVTAVFFVDLVRDRGRTGSRAPAASTGAGSAWSPSPSAWSWAG